MLMTRRIKWISILIGLLVLPATVLSWPVPDSVTTNLILLEDDFNDNSIDPAKWEIRENGYRVIEDNGIMKIEQAQTDNGGYLYSKWFNLSYGDVLTVERKVNVHYANEYFAGGLGFIFKEETARNFSVNYSNYAYAFDGYCANYGFFISRYGANPHLSSRQADVSSRIEPVWNQWFTEKIIYNSVSGFLEYYINSEKRLSYYVGTLPETNSYEMRLEFGPWGWWTGHYHYMDDIRVSLSTPVIGPSVGTSGKFIFPVLGVSISDPLNNTNDPLQDGWDGKGVGQLSAADGHLGQDYYLKNGDSAGKPVFAICTGEVVQVMNGPGQYGWCDDSDHGWGPVVVLKHYNDKGFKVSDNAITHVGECSTDRNPKVVYSLYGHLSKESIKNIKVGQTFNTGDPIGVIGQYVIDNVSWTTNHLHFEIKDEIGFLEGAWYIFHPGECPGSAAQSCEAKGIGTGYSHRQGFAPNRYIPSVFILENQGNKGRLQGFINLLLRD